VAVLAGMGVGDEDIWAGEVIWLAVLGRGEDIGVAVLVGGDKG
jgi:hypothetical protein